MRACVADTPAADPGEAGASCRESLPDFLAPTKDKSVGPIPGRCRVSKDVSSSSPAVLSESAFPPRKQSSPEAPRAQGQGPKPPHLTQALTRPRRTGRVSGFGATT